MATTTDGSVGRGVAVPAAAAAEAERLLRLRALLLEVAPPRRDPTAGGYGYTPAVYYVPKPETAVGRAAPAMLAAVNQRLGELVADAATGRPPPHSPSDSAADRARYLGVLRDGDATLRIDPACHLFDASTAAAVA